MMKFRRNYVIDFAAVCFFIQAPQALAQSTSNVTPIQSVNIKDTRSGNNSGNTVGSDVNNAVAKAEDGFGNQSGKESIGIYDESQVRGFSPNVAGNLRIEGMYFDKRAYLGHFLIDGSRVRVGATVSGYVFPAPTGIVDYQLRKVGDERKIALSLEGEMNATSGDGAFDINALLPLSAPESPVQYGMSVAGGLVKEHAANGGHSLYRSLGLVGRIRSRDFNEEANRGFEFLPFYGDDKVIYETPNPLWVTQDAMPPSEKIHQLRNKERLHADWLRTKSSAITSGGIWQHYVDENWLFKASWMRSRTRSPLTAEHVFEQVNSQNSDVWLNTAYINPSYFSSSDSSEIRLTKNWKGNEAVHQWHTIWRSKKASTHYGGDAYFEWGQTDFSSGIISINYAPSMPIVKLVRFSIDDVKQNNFGWAYEFQNAHWIVNAGMMKTRYEKRTYTPKDDDAFLTSRTEESLFQNYWNTSYRLSDKTSLYAGQTRGLEESGVAPVIANNRFTALPAIRTKQSDMGMRWKFKQDDDTTQIVLGVFEVSKPYAGMTSQQNFELVGDVKHRGIEGSVATNIAQQWNIVLGGVYVDAKATRKGSSTTSRPTGSSPLDLKTYVEYTLPKQEHLSVDAGLEYTAPRVISEHSDNRAPRKAILSLGIRYHFEWRHYQGQLRLQMTNVTNQRIWNVEGENTFMLGKPRSLKCVFTIDM